MAKKEKSIRGRTKSCPWDEKTRKTAVTVAKLILDPDVKPENGLGTFILIRRGQTIHAPDEFGNFFLRSFPLTIAIPETVVREITREGLLFRKRTPKGKVVWEVTLPFDWVTPNY